MCVQLKPEGFLKSAYRMFLLRWLLLASSAALFLTVGSQGPCVPANCSADLPPLCNCDENCTEFAEDCCDPQHLESTLQRRCVVEGQVNRSLVCANGSLNVTVPACPGDLVRMLMSDASVATLILSSRTVGLVYDYCGHLLEVCVPQLVPIPPLIVAISSVSYSLSILGGVFILLTYSLFKELRTLPGILLMNLSVTIIMLNIFRTAPLVLRRIEPNSERVIWVVCFSIQVYFIYTESMWMSFLLLQMARSLYLAWKLSRPSMFSPVYLVPIGWGLPILVCFVPIVTYSFDVPFLFYIPLNLAVVVNFSLLIAATVFLCLFSRNRRRIKHSYHHDLIRLWIAFFAVTIPALTALFDLFYIRATTTPRGLSFLMSNVWVVYATHVLSGSQVFAIALAFLCTKKILKLYRDLFTCTSQNTNADVNPMPFIGPEAAQVGEMPTREGAQGEIPIGDGETPTGEGETPTGQDGTSTGERETSRGEGEEEETPMDGETPMETPTGEGETHIEEEETPLEDEGEEPSGEEEVERKQSTGDARRKNLEEEKS